MLIYIEPDKTAEAHADVRYGQVPLEVNFTGSSSESPIDSWTWDFGDNDSGFVQSPTHVYTEPGRYDIMLHLKKSMTNYFYPAEKYITAFADTLEAVWTSGKPGDKVCVDVNLSNTQPLSAVKIPVNFKGQFHIQYDSISYVGTRAGAFDVKSVVNLDPYFNYRLTVSMYNTSSPDLEPGSGTIAKLYFTIPGGTQVCKTIPITFEGYSTYAPTFSWEVMDYEPAMQSSEIYTYLCGDVNKNGKINLTDILNLINYKYQDLESRAPKPMEAGDANGDGVLDLTDILYLIDYIYAIPPGPAPICP
jgi:PKD repeat protein